MLVRRKEGIAIGFTEIFTPDYPDLTLLSPLKKLPYIIFKLPRYLPAKEWRYQYLNQLYLETKTTIKTMANLGLTITDDQHHYITIRGHRKVAKAIQLFKTLEEYPADSNRDLINYLTQYQLSCEEWCKLHPKKTPHKSKPLSSFVDAAGQPVDLNTAKRTSFNPTLTVKKKDSGSSYILKTYTENRGIANFESANGMLHRLMRGICHPKTRLIYDNGKRIGSLSKKYPNYTSIRKYAEKYGPITADLIISSEMIKDFVLFYTEQEDDANSNNYGFVEFIDLNGKKILLSIKFDNDRMMWRVVSKYFGIDPEGLDLNSGSNVKPIDTFCIFNLNLSTFPKLPKKMSRDDWRPTHWYDNGIQVSFFEPNWEEKAFKNEKFIHDRNYTFLKRSLIPDEAVIAIGNANFTSQEMKKAFIDNKTGITDNIQLKMLHDDYMLKYLTSQSISQDIIQIWNEFNEYNKDFKKPEDKFLHVNLQIVKEEFYKLQTDANNNLHIAPRMPSIIEPLPLISTTASLKLPNTPKTPNTPQTPTTPNTPNNNDRDSNQNKKRKAEEDKGSTKRQKLNPTAPLSPSGTKTSDSSLSASNTLSIVKNCLMPDNKPATLQTSSIPFMQSIPLKPAAHSVLLSTQTQPANCSFRSIPINTTPQQPYSGIPAKPVQHLSSIAVQIQQQKSGIPIGTPIPKLIQQPSSSIAVQIPQQNSGKVSVLMPPPATYSQSGYSPAYFSQTPATAMTQPQNYAHQNRQIGNPISTSNYKNLEGHDPRIVNHIQSSLTAKTWNNYTNGTRISMIDMLKQKYGITQTLTAAQPPIINHYALPIPSQPIVQPQNTTISNNHSLLFNQTAGQQARNIYQQNNYNRGLPTQTLSTNNMQSFMTKDYPGN